MTPASYDYWIYQGDNFSDVIEVVDQNNQPYSFDGFSVRMHLKEHINADPALELGTEDGSITLELGQIVLVIPREKLESIKAQDYHYDLEITYPDGSQRTWMNGIVHITMQRTI